MKLHGPISGISIVMISVFLVRTPVSGEVGKYDRWIKMLSSRSQVDRAEAAKALAGSIKSEVLGYNPQRFSINRFHFAHISSPVTQDLAIAISYPPYEGNLVILRLIDGRYTPIQPLTRLGFIEAVQSVRLFSERRDQLMLNMSGGGTDWRHWAKDIYHWDGSAMQLVWAGLIKDITTRFTPDGRDDPARLITGNVSFRTVKGGNSKDIIANYRYEEGLLDQTGLGLRQVKLRKNWTLVYSWDSAFYFYLSRYGKVTATSTDISCWETPFMAAQKSRTVTEGTRVGILDAPELYGCQTPNSRNTFEGSFLQNSGLVYNCGGTSLSNLFSYRRSSELIVVESCLKYRAHAIPTASR